MRIALIGQGRMALAIGRLAETRGHTVATRVSSGENAGGSALTPERLAGVEVAFEFTRSEAAPANLLQLARLRIPVVVGTTGWLAQLPEVAAAVQEHGAALLHGPNFSTGVQLFLRAAGDLARRMASQAQFDGFVVERHHWAKPDAPSGTAVALAAALHQGDGQRPFPVSSIRAGHDPGTHTVVFDAPFETIRLEHNARGREAFAAGAVAAGEWLPGRHGVFTFAQMLFGEEP